MKERKHQPQVHNMKVNWFRTSTRDDKIGGNGKRSEVVLTGAPRSPRWLAQKQSHNVKVNWFRTATRDDKIGGAGKRSEVVLTDGPLAHSK